LVLQIALENTFVDVLVVMLGGRVAAGYIGAGVGG
jgi:hypothetical protein